MTGPARFRKRPLEVTALRVDIDMPHRRLQEFTDNLVRADSDDALRFAVYDKLHHCWIPFRYGDWLIRGTAGEFYPCDGDVFDTIYEPVEGS